VIKNLHSQLTLVIFMAVFASDVWCAEVDLSRLKMDDQLSKKSANHYGSINDKRQDVGGFITLRDDGSSLKEPLGGFKWRVVLFGKPCGMESAKAEWLVFSIKEGEDQLSLQGSLRMHSEPIATVYDKVGSGKYGFEYFGYAVLVRSTSDPKKYLVKSDKKVLEQSPEKLEGLKSGQLLDKSWVVLREGVRPSEGIWFR
jgi:hypothetical protein